MSGSDDFEDFGDLDLDLDDALDAWEQEIEKDGVVRPESAPLPQHSTPATPSPPAEEGARPLYRPDPELMGRKPSPMESRRISSPDDFDDDFDDDEDESTRIAAVPEDLMRELQALRGDIPDSKPKPERPTAAPPPDLEAVDLDLDDFLDDEDEVTRVGSVADLAALEKELLDPFEDAAQSTEPTSAESTLDVSIDAFQGGGPSAPEPAAPKPAAPKPAAPKPAAPKLAAPKPAMPRPAVPKPRAPGPPKKFKVPAPAGRSVPKPPPPRAPVRQGKPAAPRPPPPRAPGRPGAPPPPAAEVPKPARPATPPPAIARSIPKPAVPSKLAVPKPAAPREPAAPARKPPGEPVAAATPVPAPAAVDVEVDEILLDIETETPTTPPPASERPPQVAGEPSALLDLVPPTGASEHPAAAKPDLGAATAKRTVAQRKPRKERYAFIGHDTDTQRRRRKLLEKLAEGAEGTPKARLLVAAAEIAEALGEIDDARTLMERAREADPADLGILRWWRRDAVARGDWAEMASLLEREAALPLSPADREACLALLAEVRLVQLGDAAGAADAAQQAREAGGPSLVTSLLGAEALRESAPADAARALTQARSDADAELEIATRLLAGRLLERSGELEEAAQSYGAAVARARHLEPLLGLARTSPSASRRRDALRAAAEAVTNPALAECLRRAASRVWLAHGDDPAISVGTLEASQRPTSLRLQAMAAQRAGDADTRRAALHALSGVTGGTVRALALLDLAEVQAAAGELDEADESLRGAALADPNLDAVQAVREVLARRAGDPSRLAAAIETGGAGRGAIEAAAKLASRAEDLARERQELAAAAEEGAQPIMVDILALDVAAEAGDVAEVLAALQRSAERATPERRLGALMAIAERGDVRAAFTQAREAMPGHPAVVRPLARLVGDEEPATAAEAWLEEANAAIDGRAAHAAVVAARYFAEANAVEPALEAARRALEAQPGHGPAAWILDGDLGAGIQGDERRILFDQLGESFPVAGARAWAFARRALLGGEGASEAWERAAELMPDPVAEELALGSGEGAAAQASRLEARAETHPEQARSILLRAGLGYERGDEPGKAATVYEKLLAEGHDPLALRALDRAQAAAGAVASIIERRFASVREAEGTPRELAALEELARIDLHGGGDPQNAALTLQTILSQKPGHLPSLRSLERFYMDGGRDAELRDIWEALVAHLPDPLDRLAPARMAAHLRLAEPEALGSAADALWNEHGASLIEAQEPIADRTWIARRIATTHADAAVRGRARLAEADALADEERATVLIEGLADLSAIEGALERGARLEDVAGRLPQHPLLPEVAARQHAEAESHAAAADAFRRAAAQAAVPEHRMPLLYAAARAYEEAGNRSEAKAAYLEASQLDVTYHDLFERLRDLLEADGDTNELADLADRRLAAGGDATVMRSLRRTQAALKATMGDRAGARDALRAALELDPQDVDALRRLAELSLEDEDWRGAAEALIRFARLRQDRDDLRWVFFTLGDIYQRHMPDARRAEAAYRRCLKLIPDDLEAMDRLAHVYEAEGAFDKAAKVVGALANAEIDPDAKRDHQLRLARDYEQAGDLRTAEQVLDATRKQAPTDLVVLRAIAELYQRQNAASAQSMHLGRAIADFHRALERDMTDAFAWEGLAEMHEWRNEADAGRAVASAAAAVGIRDEVIMRRLDASGAAPGVGAAAADPQLRELLAPRSLSPATFELFRLGGEIFDKVLPFDSRAWKTEKVGREHPLKVEALRVAQWFGYGDVTVLITDVAPRICIPVGADPLTLVVGRALSTSTDAHERAFLFARATKLAISHLSVAMRTHPGQLALCFAGLAKTYDPMYSRPDLDRRELEEWARKVHKAIPRRIRDNLGPVAIEVIASAGFDAASLGLAAAELGDRAALLAVGSTPAATRALLALAGIRSDVGDPPHERIAAIKQVPEAWDLLRFAISDGYFEARRRAGADRM